MSRPKRTNIREHLLRVQELITQMRRCPEIITSRFSLIDKLSGIDSINRLILEEHLAKRAAGQRKDIQMEAPWPEQMEPTEIPPIPRYQSMGVTTTLDGAVRCWVLDTFTGECTGKRDPDPDLSTERSEE